MRKMSYKKIAAFVLAGTMAIGMSATALAAGGVSTSTGEEGVSSINIIKKVETDGNTYAPNYTFNFSVTSGPTRDFEGNKVTAGKEDDVTVTGATFTSATEVNSEYTETGSLSFNAKKYSKPGVYSYTVKESDVDYEGIDKDKSSYTVYVYVANKTGGEYYISNVVSTKDDANNTKEDITFTNDYGKINGKVHSVTIKKVVKGNQADLTKKFDFSLNMTGGEDGEKYKVATPSGAQSITTGGNISGIKMGNNEEITVYGLTESDVYKVVEENYASEGYKTYVDAQSGNEKREATGKATEANVTKTFYNIKEVGTPTGIIMSYAPYIAMLAAACILAVVFFNRRREDA